jgi:hypothetical protein
MYFHGSDFNSYGATIGRIETGKDGRIAYLISKAHYSITTSAHQSHMRAAIPFEAVKFFVPDIFRNHADTLNAWTREVNEALDTANQSREPKKSRLIGEAAATVKKMQEFAEFFGLKKVKYPLIPASKDELSAILKKREQQAKADATRRETARRKAAELQREEMAAEREKWLSGTSNGTAWSWGGLFTTELRINGANVETSQGASFPVDHARVGLALVESVIRSKTTWQTNGHTCHLGHYQIDRITPDGTVYAGCHVVPYSAIERIADALRAAA